MKNWAQLQRDLFKNIRREVEFYIQHRPKELVRYEKEFLRDRTTFRETSHPSLVESINHADIVFIGDFHTLRQSQRLLLRLLRDKDVKKPKVIGLEILSPRHEKALYEWLRHPTFKKETELKKLLALETKWGSSWETYQELFKLAFEHEIKLAGLGSETKNIYARDRFAAEKIGRLKERQWILFGEYHCAPSHLPAEVAAYVPESRMTIVLQNDDQATLQKLSKLSANQTMILSTRPKSKGRYTKKMDMFCVLHTPLWIKWQSYLDRQLKTSDDSADELYEGIQAHDQMLWSLQTLVSFLEDPRYPHPLPAEYVFDLAVIGPDDSDFFSSLSRLAPSKRRDVSSQLKYSTAAVLPEKKRVYLTELTVNSCAHAAGSYLFRLWTGISGIEKSYFKYLLTETMSYMLSKLLNHSRRALHKKDWEARATAFKGSRRNEALAVLKAYQNLDRYPITHSDHFSRYATIAIARMVGDSVFEAFLTGEFSRARLIRIMTTPIASELSAFETFIELKSMARVYERINPKTW